MDVLLTAFRRAHRVSKVSTIEQAFAPLAAKPAGEIEAMSGSWEEHLLGRTMLVLRGRGLPEQTDDGKSIFDRLIQALIQSKEKPNDDTHSQTGRGTR